MRTIGHHSPKFQKRERQAQMEHIRIKQKKNTMQTHFTKCFEFWVLLVIICIECGKEMH